MVAKALLPVYGGTPAVWTVCMLFFQVVLLFAYGYAVLLSYFQTTKAWRFTHSILLLFSCIELPLLMHPLAGDGSPEWSILTNLIQLGLPLFVVAASAPLLQFAYSQTKEKGASDPYFLYSASNLGSLTALLLYPSAIERFIGLKEQFHLWNIGYVIYLILLFFLFYTRPYEPLFLNSSEKSSWPSWQTIAYWIILSFVPCSLMLGVTLYITTDVAATPLFWVLPLALYLLTFVIVFRSKPLSWFPWLQRNSIFFLVFAILCFILNASQVRVWQSILFNLLNFFVFSLLCHRQLFLIRPKPQALTLFYLCLAFGGVLAGVFNGLIAPHLFNQVYEYPLAILLSILVLPSTAIRTKNALVLSLLIPLVVFSVLLSQYVVPEIHWPGHFSTFQISALVALALLAIWQPVKLSMFFSLFILFGFIFSPALQNEKILMQERNFYGVKKVVDKGIVHVLISQSTIHGLQLMNQQKPTGLSSYYGAVKPVIDFLKQEYTSMSATLIGLGVGTLSCQFREQDKLKLIEIDDQVINLARDSRLFTYLRDCSPKMEIIKKDGRLAVEQLPDHSQQLILVDAFNSDAIPVHLITLEALNLYKQKITPEGALLINLSNRHLELLPVFTAASRFLDLMIFYTADEGDPALGQFASEWVLLTLNEELIFKITNNKGWHFVAKNKQILWTDDYSNLIPLLKWW
jgi:spermidine synthase